MGGRTLPIRWPIRSPTCSMRRKDDKPVFVVEYVAETDKVQAVVAQAARDGLIPHAAERSLGQLRGPLPFSE